jgi:hypothetical protein
MSNKHKTDAGFILLLFLVFFCVVIPLCIVIAKLS